MDRPFENADLYRASVTDELTQINNVRYFRIRLHNEIMRAKKDETPLALLMFDIDHFKSINDKYGHQVGDHAIRAMANALKMGVRGGDIVARYGGEEMAAILPGASLETALVVAERLRAHVAEIIVESDLGPVRFTTSVGVSTLPTDATEMEALIGCADQALYRAKREGRNRVIKF
ncbi:MAG: GGDEF domain-containing protein [Proteobacteria bacterium]|nr:MAG: GGDEF domain-containing protein [Pseudomonadota bacterium]